MMTTQLRWLALVLLLGARLTYGQDNALSFDGSDDRVTGPLPSIFTNIAANDLTVEAWVKLDSRTTFQRVLFAQFNTDNYVTLALDAGGTLIAYVKRNGVPFSQSVTSQPLTPGQWTHVAMSWRASSNTIQLYINGVPRTMTTQGSSSDGVNNTLAIGARTDGEQPLHGTVDEVKIWSGVRSTAQIFADQSTAGDPEDPALVAYYSFDQGVANGLNPTVTSLANQADPTQSGTLAGFALSGSSSNWVPGRAVTALPTRPGNALSFDGSNDRVAGALPAVFGNIAANDLTVEAWVMPASTAAFQRVVFAQLNASNFVTLTLGAGGNVYGYVRRGATTFSLVTSTPISTNQWTHLALTWQPAISSLQLYVNGTTVPTGFGGSSSSGTDNLLVIGARTDGAQPYNGVVDEVKIWSVARSQAQVGLDAASEADPTDPALAAYFDFNQGVANGTNTTVTTLANRVNPSQRKSLVNFALSGTTSNWVPGRVAGPLPVQLTAFTASATNGKVQLRWATAQEQNCERFVLSQSSDGHTFRPLGTVGGAGTTSRPSHYSYTDPEPHPGLNYYRLEQVDSDGKISQLGVRVVQVGPATEQAAAYPNPTTDWLYLPTLPAGLEEIRLTDLHGRLCQAIRLSESQTAPALNLAGLPAGTYLLTLRGPGQTLTQKVTKY